MPLFESAEGCRCHVSFFFAAESLDFARAAMSEPAEEKLLGHRGDDALSRTDRERGEHKAGAAIRLRIVKIRKRGGC